jgi:hypothetical protein
VTLADFHSEETVPELREWLKSEQRLGAIIALHSFIIRPGIPSGPVALDGSRWYRCLETSSSETVNVGQLGRGNHKGRGIVKVHDGLRRTEDRTEIGVK